MIAATVQILSSPNTDKQYNLLDGRNLTLPSLIQEYQKTRPGFSFQEEGNRLKVRLDLGQLGVPTYFDINRNSISITPGEPITKENQEMYVRAMCSRATELADFLAEKGLLLRLSYEFKRPVSQIKV